MEWNYSSIRTLDGKMSPIPRPLLGAFMVRANGKRVCTNYLLRVCLARKIKVAWGKFLIRFLKQIRVIIFEKKKISVIFMENILTRGQTMYSHRSHLRIIIDSSTGDRGAVRKNYLDLNLLIIFLGSPIMCLK